MSRVGFTFIWKIENFSFLPKLHKKEDILSPVFIADNLEKTSWFLRLYPPRYINDSENKYVFQLCKNSESGPNCISLDYELSILSNAGSKISRYVKPVKVHKFRFHMGNAHGTPLSIAPNEIFGLREILQNDTLTVRCKMWLHNSQWNLEPGFSMARTQIDVERKFFTWTIDNFSALKAEDQKSASVLMFSNQKIYLTLTLSISVQDILIRIEGKSKGRNSLLLLGISVQDVDRKSAHYFQSEYALGREKEEYLFPLILKRTQLMEAKDSLLPGDKLSLKCDLEVYNIVLNQIELSGLGANLTSDLEASLSNANQSVCLGKRKRHSNCNSLTKDLRYLFEEKQHADVSLRVQNETFPVHKAVLAARSSVFKAMFDTDMKEKSTNTIEIDDIQPDTMRRLLQYVYSETLDSDIQWENVSSLYLAAEKYAVLGLKEECSSYLMANLSINNACETLVLADMLSDKDFYDFVLSFMQDKDQAVLNSDEWKNFTQTHPQLTIDILTRLYKNVKQF